MKIGLLGFGVVGRGVYDLVADRDDIQVAKVLCLEARHLPAHLPDTRQLSPATPARSSA